MTRMVKGVLKNCHASPPLLDKDPFEVSFDFHGKQCKMEVDGLLVYEDYFVYIECKSSVTELDTKEMTKAIEHATNLTKLEPTAFDQDLHCHGKDCLVVFAYNLIKHGHDSLIHFAKENQILLVTRDGRASIALLARTIITP